MSSKGNNLQHWASQTPQNRPTRTISCLTTPHHITSHWTTPLRTCGVTRSYMKKEVFPGSSDVDMCDIVETMGVRQLQQLASLFQEFQALPDEPLETLGDKVGNVTTSRLHFCHDKCFLLVPTNSTLSSHGQRPKHPCLQLLQMT